MDMSCLVVSCNDDIHDEELAPQLQPNPLCKRARSRAPGSCSLIATDVLISDGDLFAKLVSKSGGEIINGIEEVKPLILRLSAYNGGILRVKVDEDHSLNPMKKRFEVPDVVE
ncbi:hypothetical protein QQ045_015221 [Rhodiola kirilowii]